MLTEEALVLVAALAAVGLIVLGAVEVVWPSRRRTRLPPRPEATEVPPRLGGSPPAREAAETPLAAAPLERSFELYQGGRFDEVVALVTVALQHRRGETLAESAALQSVLGLARQALGDLEGARAALEAAIQEAPARDRHAYEVHLASLAEDVGRGRLARAQSLLAADSQERLADIQEAIAWAERGLAATADDPALLALLADARQQRWPATEQLVMALVQRQDFTTARRVLREALADASVPPGYAETFRELLLGTFSGEIGQLTAHAIRSMQEAREAEALASLERAEELLGSIPGAALPPKRREEVDRRLWWGFTNLGRRRLEAGAFEAAIEPLCHALRYAATLPERGDETRSALVRAVDGFVEGRLLALRERADSGQRREAIVEAEALEGRLRQMQEVGLSASDVAGPVGRIERLLGDLGRSRLSS